MARKFAEIAFTLSIKAAQTRYGSRAGASKLDQGEMSGDRLGEMEAAFIAARDGFYQATVTEDGWLYVQFRGGSAGFLKVLDERTIAYADFRGNVQYLSTGNIAGNDRVALIFRDYANRARLKVLGHVRLSEAPSYAVPVLTYDTMSKGSIAYRALAQEILARHKRT